MSEQEIEDALDVWIAENCAQAPAADAITKKPSEYFSQCLVMYAVPFQWDSLTGECNFLAHWEAGNPGTRGIRRSGQEVYLTAAEPETCDRYLSEADEDDLLKVWAVGAGSFEYLTRLGTKSAIPAFDVRKAEVLAKG